MRKPRHGYHVAPEHSIYVSDGYKQDTFAVYAWQDLPAYTSSPVNPVRCYIKGGFSTREEALQHLLHVVADKYEQEA
jgi:hypothetical protein